MQTLFFELSTPEFRGTLILKSSNFSEAGTEEASLEGPGQKLWQLFDYGPTFCDEVEERTHC